MTLPGANEGFPFLSVLIFSPLLGAAVAALIRDERVLRWWTFIFTAILTALYVGAVFVYVM